MSSDNEVRKMNIFEHVQKTKRTILREENLLGDSSFKIVFTEPKVALKLLRTLIPFLDKDPKKSLDAIMQDSVSTYKFYDVELKGIESSKRLSSISMTSSCKASSVDDSSILGESSDSGISIC